ncbi:MAG: hypothetical protein DCF15_09475 [Phormidesmis priestleyi]|uniref:Uncharacterized protein n=1 Tax=Phormidesmis priestleyi TaxID=268141 RepID=A0A2W4XFR2_9CYAN|nr:MAG: hypothetical protein DCF15_09475 [Phormidesmis priestleyi]
MTYTNQTNVETTNQADFATTDSATTAEQLKELRKEGSVRSQRIFKILRAAFTKTAAEVAAEIKDGRTVISPLAKEVSAKTVATVKEKGQQAADTVNQTWQQEAQTEDRTERFVKVVRSLANTLKQTFFPQAKQQAKKQADHLVELLRNRYAASSQRAAETATAPQSTPTVVDITSSVIEEN